jgi:hypothetical protein
MSIDKIIPVRIDRSADFKRIPSTSMVDALNVLITENEGLGVDYGIHSSGSATAEGGGLDGGNLGVMKSVPGNVGMKYEKETDAFEPGHAKIIGSVTDTKLKILYFFVWHEQEDEHGVWAYDPQHKLPNSTYVDGRIRKIHKSKFYNFPENGFVKADIIYTSQSRLTEADKSTSEFDKDIIMYFTDNTNEPRKLNVSMAVLGLDGDYSDADKIDFITACPKTPLAPITFGFASDSTQGISNFKSGPGFQFAYQYVYKDGVETAISPYSDIAFAPVILSQGTQTTLNHNINNVCLLSIPTPGSGGLTGTQTPGAEIKAVKILARQFNNQDIVILEEVDWDPDIENPNWDPETGTYRFYNDRIVSGVSTNEFNKQFDNIPRKAQAQSVVDNRLMYGNYLEGFDNVETDCVFNITYRDKTEGSEGIDYTLRAKPAISEQPRAKENSYGESPGANYKTVNKSAGYYMSGTQLPEQVNAGTQIDVILKVSPDYNFHIYQATDSYHQSRHRGVTHVGDSDGNWVTNQINYDWQNETSPGVDWQTFNDEYGGGNYGHQSRSESGAVFCQEETLYSSDGEQQQGITYAGNNYGVGGAPHQEGAAIIDPMAAQSYTFNSPRWKTSLGPKSGEETAVCYGTSAGNPLIIKGGVPLEFTCSFVIDQDINDDADEQILDIIYKLFTRSEGVEIGGNPPYTVLDLKNTADHIIDLEALTNFYKFAEGTEYSKLITGVVKKQMINDYKAYQPPIGHFIVKKAKVKFAFEKDNYFDTIDYRKIIRLTISRVTDVETVTVVRKRYPSAPWICLTKEYLQAGDFSNFIGETHTNYSGQLLADLPHNFATDEGVSNQWWQTEEVYLIPPDAESGENYNPYPYLICKYGDSDTFDLTRDFGSLNYYQEANFTPPGTSGEQGYEGYGQGQYDVYHKPVIPGLTPSLGEEPPDSLNSFEDCDEILKEKWFLGYLDFQQSITTNGLQEGGEIEGEVIINEFFRFDRELWEGTFNNWNSSSENQEIFPFSLLDGESGPGGDLTHNLAGGIDNVPETSSIPRRYKLLAHGGMTGQELPGYDAPDVFGYGIIYLQGPEYSGSINSTFKKPPSLNISTPSYAIPLIDDPAEGTGYNRSFLALMQGARFTGLNPAESGDINEFPYTSPKGNQNVSDFNIDFTHLHPHIEFSSLLFSFLDSGIVGEGTDAYRTFKSSANHDFGIIYYDERGRHGFVNPLGTVYVPGYSEAERGGPNYGASEITVTLNHQPPVWAHYYKLAYTKNTTVQSFIQYAAGGAFIVPDSGQSAEQRVKIYVSLNYLQEHPISYVASWGARDPEGGISMFKYISGGNQKVRIVSYQNDAEQRQYPNNYEFDVVDTVLLGTADNPLFDTGEDITTNPEKVGEFLILRDNTEALGFNFNELTTGNDSGYWDNNCIMEIFTPMKGMEEDNRFYYEIGDTYDILNVGEINRSHSVPEILVPGGDVWWRRVPINTRKYQDYLGVFQDLIKVDSTGEDKSDSRFKAYYVETETASDLFKADATFIGRPNIALKDAVETVREASITYSQQSNPNSRKINYSSFNRTLSNFKELQEEFGDINYMCNLSGDVFVIQSDKCTLVPASKTLFSDVSGTDIVAASKSPLGQEKIFAGRAGCDNNPESVAQVGSYIYFAHKRLGKVFRFNPSSGVQELSDQGLGAYFRSLFKKALAVSENINYEDVRVVGGFNPLQQEYLLTVLYPRNIAPITTESTDDPYEDYAGGDLMDDVVEIVTLVHFGFDQPNYANPEDYTVDSPFNMPIDFGGIPKTTAGTEASETFVITNSGTVDVIIDLREMNENKFHNFNKYLNNWNLGRYWNPSIVNVVNEAGEVQLNGGSGGIESGTFIPAGMSHTFTINLNVNKQTHSLGPALEWLTAEEATDYLIETYGTAHRALTGPERQSINTGTSSEPEYNLNPYYDFEFTFDVYDANTYELLNPQTGSPNTAQTYWPYWVQQVQYTVTELEGDEDYDGPTILGDLNGDGVVGVQDLLQILGQYGSIGGNLTGDLNNDDAVTVGDLLILLNNFGQNAPSLDEIIEIPPLDIIAFGNTLINALEDTYGLDTSEATTYVDLAYMNEIITMQILQSSHPDVYNFINEGNTEASEMPPFTIFVEVYLLDNDGNPIIIE